MQNHWIRFKNLHPDLRLEEKKAKPIDLGCKKGKVCFLNEAPWTKIMELHVSGKIYYGSDKE